MRLVEGVLFGSLAAGAHIGFWAIAPITTGTAINGGAGAAEATISAATGSHQALVVTWVTPPETGAVRDLVAPISAPSGSSEPVRQIHAPPLSGPAPMRLAQLPKAELAPTIDTTTPAAPRAQPQPPRIRPEIRPAPKKAAAPPAQANKARTAKGSGSQKQSGTGGAARTQSETASQANALRAEWGAAIYAKVKRNMRAPQGVKASGTARLALRVAANGTLQGLSLTRSSGHPALDKAALQAIKRAGRFAEAPAGLSGGNHDFSLSLTFSR
jgi:protein TonB